MLMMQMPEEEPERALIQVKKGEVEDHRAFDVLANVRSENVWLANFSSENTRDAYHRSIASFVATIGINEPDELHSVTQRLARVDGESGVVQATIASRLSALSSLYKHLTDEQLTRSNPVARVRRPKTGNAGIGAGKSPTLSKRQVRAMLDAPDTSTLRGLRDRALLHVYFYAGARCSEPANLKVRDFTYDAEFPVLRLKIKGGKEDTVLKNLRVRIRYFQRWSAISSSCCIHFVELLSEIKKAKGFSFTKSLKDFELYTKYESMFAVCRYEGGHIFGKDMLSRNDMKDL